MIYIVLPTYNEEIGLSELLAKIKEVKDEYQVVLVNDGSTDRTEKIAHHFSKDLPLKIITHKKNRGLGEALKSGLNYILPRLKNEDVVVTLDADNTHPPELIPQMVEKITQGKQLVIASRFCQGGKEIGLHFLRRFLSRGACWLLKLFFPFKVNFQGEPYPGVNPVRNGVPLFRKKGGISNGVKDYTSGYRAYAGNLLKQATNFYGEKFINEKGFTVMAEILIKLRKLKPAVVEIPLLLRYDLKKSKSKIKIISTIIRYLILSIKNILLERN